LKRYKVVLILEFEDWPEGESCDAFESYEDEIRKSLNIDFEYWDIWQGSCRIQEIVPLE